MDTESHGFEDSDAHDFSPDEPAPATEYLDVTLAPLLKEGPTMPTIGVAEIVIMLAVLAAVLYALVLLIKVLRKASRRLDGLEAPGRDQGPLGG